MSAKWRVGDRIENRWEVHRILRGGMGIVYVVYDLVLQEALAAKTHPDEVFARSPVIAKRFRQEALTLVKLDAHQNVTQARFVQNIEGKPFLFQEYISGGDLGGWIGTSRLTDDLPQVLLFAVQFCYGMLHAISKGIKVHRDVKPQNCLVTGDRTLKVTDFGLATVFDESDFGGAIPSSTGQGDFFGRLFGRTEPGKTDLDKRKEGSGLHSNIVTGQNEVPTLVESMPDDSTLNPSLPLQVESEIGPQYSLRRPSEGSQHLRITRTGQGAGTPPFMAPEQFDDAKHVDGRADIYSFGVMLYEMITGQLPFVGRSWTELKRAHKTQEPPLANVPQPELRAIVETCLRKDPARRFTDFGQVEDRLSTLYKDLTGCAVPRPLGGKQLTATELVNKGVSLANLGRTEGEISCYDRALELNPQYAEAWFNKAFALQALRQFRDALTCYERALELGLPLAARGIASCRQALRHPPP